ncbi:MAG: R3H domain-containing nucleic acid-binding protein [Candidatus Xenobia bacterium]
MTDLKITDDLERLMQVLPSRVRDELEKVEGRTVLVEVVLDLGREPEARLPEGFVFLSGQEVTRDDLRYVVSRVGAFGNDNRAGIERTLHRISCIRNRAGDIVGLTCRVGRSVQGTINVIRDIVESGRSILLLGRPGVGKTTMLREVARVLADEMNKRVIVVDTSNEIAGDGDVPHPGIGHSRRMQVPHSDLQHAVMIEAVENHMPEVIVVDEIGTEAEAYAARTIAERGVQLVATAHGNTLQNLIANPTLSDLVGGIQAVTLSDEEARKRGTQKTVLERKAPPTFDVVVEIKDQHTLVLHAHVEEVIDLILRGTAPQPEVRVRDEAGHVEVVQESNLQRFTGDVDGRAAMAERHDHRRVPVGPDSTSQKLASGGIIKVFPYAVSRNRLERAIETLKVSAEIVRSWDEADVIVTLKGHDRRDSGRLRMMQEQNVKVCVVKSNTVNQIQGFLRELFHVPMVDIEELAMREAEEASRQVLKYHRPIELSPQSSHIRRMQHEVAEKFRLKSISTGHEPNRRLKIYKD